MKRLFIVGVGPGGHEHRTPAADQALDAASELVGYGLYLELLGTRIAGKQCHRLPLGDEIARARVALGRAGSGRSVALVSSGDPGIYAMATLVFELMDREPRPEWADVEVEVIPGVSALQATAALVGAPIAHDFCTISLSDLLTPWETIEARVRGAGIGDFVVAFFNPVSRRRTWQLERARDVLLEYRPNTTAVILGRNVSRPQQKVEVIELGQLTNDRVDMLTLVIVGNRETRRVGRWVYTPRGYARRLEQGAGEGLAS